MERVTIILNGTELSAYSGMTILGLAQQKGVYIPTLCHDPHLKPVGACRVCLVEDEKTGNLLASCVTPIESGMVINTKSQKVLEARKTVVELILAAHPDSCIICDKGNHCQLRKIASELGIGYIELDRVRRYHQIETANPFIERELSKCIMCGKCVRGCQEIEEIGAIDYAYRGFKAKPATSLDLPLEQSICEFCGLCVYLCPVGALTDKLSRYKGEAKQGIRTVCPYCGVGCSIYLNVRDNEVISVSPAENDSVNGISLCVRGRYGYDFINSPERLTRPLIRIAPKTRDASRVTRNEFFREATWEEALGFVATKLAEIKERHGGSALAGIGSYRCTNEENYLLQKFFRTVFSSNNIDNLERLNVWPVLDTLEEAIGVNTNSIDEIENSDVILVIGSNITESHPIIGRKIKRAVRQKGAKLIIVNPFNIQLSKFADIHLKNKPSTEVALINGLLNVIISEGLWNREFISKRIEGFEEIKEHLRVYTPENVKAITGISAEDIRQAALLYASAKRAFIISGQGIVQYGYGADIALSLANLAMLTGNVGKEGNGIYHIVHHNNLQGMLDMGVMPDYLPGYQKFNDPVTKEKFEKEWGIKLPEKTGLNMSEMLNAAKNGKIKGMYIMGDNLVHGYADKKYVVEALKSLDFLVVQDIFVTETGELADVILPAASFAEKDGTFTNVDRRIQRIRKAIEPVGESKPDWQIISELSALMGYPMKYESASEIMEEIARLTPIYGGISYDRLEKGSLQWPCPDEKHPGTKFFHKDTFTHGLSLRRDAVPEAISRLEAILKNEIADRAALYNSGTGTMAQRSSGLRYLMEMSEKAKVGK